MNNETPNDSRQNRPFPWATLIIALAFVAVSLMAYFAYIRTASGIKEVGTTVIKELPQIAEKFKTGKITTTFTSSISEINSTGGDILELATFRTDETFRRSDSKTVMWDWVYLGTTVSEIRVPVTFRYHLRLTDTWRLAARDNVCVVLAPRIRPSLPPAIHTDQIEKSTESGWARFNKDENLAELERSITPTLQQRAMDADHIRLVREACRQSTAEFVRKWLMKEDQWRDDRFTAVVVVFAGEANFKTDQELERFSYKPTIKLESKQ